LGSLEISLHAEILTTLEVYDPGNKTKAYLHSKSVLAPEDYKSQDRRIAIFGIMEGYD